VVGDEADSVDGLVKLWAKVPVGRRAQQGLLGGGGALGLEGRVRGRAVDSAKRLHLRRRAGEVPEKGPRDNAGVGAAGAQIAFLFQLGAHIEHNTQHHSGGATRAQGD